MSVVAPLRKFCSPEDPPFTALPQCSLKKILQMGHAFVAQERKSSQCPPC